MYRSTKAVEASRGNGGSGSLTRRRSDAGRIGSNGKVVHGQSNIYGLGVAANRYEIGPYLDFLRLEYSCLTSFVKVRLSSKDGGKPRCYQPGGCL